MLALLVIYIGLTYWPVERGGPGPFTPPVACTMEARICPDGSSVGRTGPNCEFAACPGVTPIEGWNTYRDGTRGISFQYPASFPATYISTVDWPPQVILDPGPFSCVEAGSETASAGKTERHIVGGREYCVTRESEGAAGSIYTQYAYAFPRGDKVVILTFTSRSVQCANYDEPKRGACEAERNSFDIDGLTDKMAQSLRLE